MRRAAAALAATVLLAACQRAEPQPRRPLWLDEPSDVPAPVTDLPRPESIPPAQCAALTAADVGRVVWAGGRPWNGGWLDPDTKDMLYNHEIIEESTPISLDRKETRCKVVGLYFPNKSRPLPTHIGIVAVVRMSRGGVIYLSYDGMGPTCLNWGQCRRIWPVPNIGP